MEVIRLIEDYLGDDLTLESADRISRAPRRHIGRMIDELTPYYCDWLEKEEAQSDGNSQGTCMLIDPRPRRDWRQQEDAFKKCLLYFPRCVFPDRLAEFLMPLVAAAPLVGGVGDNEKFRQGLRDALYFLAGMATLRDDAGVVLMPYNFAIDYESVQKAANNEFKELKRSGLRDEYYQAVAEAMEPPGRRGSHDVASFVIAHLKLNGILCARLGYVPIAGFSATWEALQRDYDMAGLSQTAPRVPNRHHRVAQALLRHEVPGLRELDMETVIKLRRNEDAFRDFRRSFGEVLDRAQKELPTDERQWQAEFAQAADDILQPRLADLRRVTSSSVVEKFFIPAALSIGAGTAAYYVADLPAFPVPAITTASFAVFNWVLDKLNKRVSKSGRKAEVLREVYGMLLSPQR
jgi:hypothetical protein